MEVNVLRLNDDGSVEKVLGRKETKNDGVFTFSELELKEGDRLKLLFYKSAGGIKNQYGPFSVSPLNANTDTNINMAFYSADGESARTASIRLRGISRLKDLGDVGSEIILAYRGYLHHSLAKHWEHVDFDSSETAELVSIIEKIGRDPESTSVVIAGEKAWSITSTGQLASAELASLPLDGSAQWVSSSVFEEAGAANLSGGQFQACMAGTSDGLLFYARDQKTIRKISNGGEWVSSYLSRPSAIFVEASQVKSLIVTAQTDGTVVLQRNIGDALAYNLVVGETPVSAAQIRRDGKRIAAITIDGTYKVWDVETEDEKFAIAEVAAGRIGKMFPNVIEFDSTGDRLIVGTGLKELENGLTLIKIAQSTSQSIDYPSSVSRLMLGTGVLENHLLVYDSDSLSKIFLVDPQNDVDWLAERFSISGILGFGVSADGKETALKIKGQEGLFHVRVDELMRDHPNGLKERIGDWKKPIDK